VFIKLPSQHWPTPRIQIMVGNGNVKVAIFTLPLTIVDFFGEYYTIFKWCHAWVGSLENIYMIFDRKKIGWRNVHSPYPTRL
jgi:hypothetical protein